MPIPENAAANDIAAVLALSTRPIAQIAAEMGIAPVSRGRYPVGPLVQAAVALARRERAGAAAREARARVTAARAREIELRTAREGLQLIPTDEAVAFTQHVVGTMIARLNGLPAQFTRDLDERRRLEAAIDGIRREVAAVVAEYGPRYRGLPDNLEEDEH